MYGTQADAVTSWHSQALLWRSQLNTEEWTSLVETFALERLWDGERRDVRLTLDDGTFHPPAVGPYWTFDNSPANPDRGKYVTLHLQYHLDALRRKMHFQCGIVDDVALHALEPLASTLGATMNMFIGWEKDTYSSAAHALLDVWLLPLRDSTAEERRAAYERCVEFAKHDFPPWGDDTTKRGYTAVLLDRLATDEKAPAALAADVLSRLTTVRTIIPGHEGIAPYLVRCALAFLGRDPDSDQRISKMLLVILPRGHPTDILTVEACVRLTELDLPAPPLVHLDEWDEWSEERLGTLQHRRPDLVERIRRLTEELGTPGRRA